MLAVGLHEPYRDVVDKHMAIVHMRKAIVDWERRNMCAVGMDDLGMTLCGHEVFTWR